MTKFVDTIPLAATLMEVLEATPETPQNLLTAIECLHQRLDTQHKTVMGELESMALKLRIILQEVKPTWNV
jgi:hypothetical protein